MEIGDYIRFHMDEFWHMGIVVDIIDEGDKRRIVVSEPPYFYVVDWPESRIESDAL